MVKLLFQNINMYPKKYHENIIKAYTIWQNINKRLIYKHIGTIVSKSPHIYTISIINDIDIYDNIMGIYLSICSYIYYNFNKGFTYEQSIEMLYFIQDTDLKYITTTCANKFDYMVIYIYNVIYINVILVSYI